MKTIKIKPLSARQQRNDTIHGYILDCIDGSGYEKELKTDKEKIEFLLSTFKKEYCHERNLRYYKTVQNTFKNWCQGLPSSFGMDFENYRIVELGKEWGLLKPDANDRQENKFIEQYWDRLYMNVLAVAKKHKVVVDIRPVSNY